MDIIKSIVIIDIYWKMIKEGCEQKFRWGQYSIDNNIDRLTEKMVAGYIMYLGNLRCENLGFTYIYEGHTDKPDSMK